MVAGSAQRATLMPPKRRRRRGPKPRQPFDKRTLLGRRAVQLAGVFRARLGPDGDDPVLLVEVERAAHLVALSEAASARALRADPKVSLDDIVRLQRAAVAAMRRLHLDRHKPQQAGLSLADILREAGPP
jgi:hypothetical protein